MLINYLLHIIYNLHTINCLLLITYRGREEGRKAGRRTEGGTEGVRGKDEEKNSQGFHYLNNQKQPGNSWRSQISGLNSSKRNVTLQAISVFFPQNYSANHLIISRSKKVKHFNLKKILNKRYKRYNNKYLNKRYLNKDNFMTKEIEPS